MYILQPVATQQTITIVSRALPSSGNVTLYLRNESTKTTATISPTTSESNGYISLSAIFSVTEGVFYNIKVVKGSTDIYRGLAFCTSQTDYDKYSVNEGAYITEPADNEFIIL